MSMLAKFNSPRLDAQIAYFLLRLTLGINILIHGAGRIFGPGAEAFATKTAADFEQTPLPGSLVHLFLFIVPFAEALAGAFTTVGLFSRWALTLGGLLIVALVFGTALRSDWATVGIQMIYAIMYYLLLANRADDRFSLDAMLHRDHQ